MDIPTAKTVSIEGKCSDFERDTYTIQLNEICTVVSITDGDYDIQTSVIIQPKDAIHIAEQILNFYKGRKLSNENN